MRDDAYRKYLVETFNYYGGGSRHSIRARPFPGQGVDTAMYVECSSEMRKGNPVGSIFEIEAKITDREGGEPFMYTSYKWPYRKVTKEEALRLLNGF